MLKYRKDSEDSNCQFVYEGKPVPIEDIPKLFHKLEQAAKIDRARAEQLNDENRDLNLDLQLAQTAIKLNERHYNELKERHENLLGLKVNIKP